MSIWQKLKPALSRFVPSHVNDPIGLIRRMVTSQNRAAFFTLWLTGLGVLLIPLDWALQFLERRRNAGQNINNHGPHIFICGPARSGTTLVYQVLASALPVTYPRNFTVLFSRAPILASKLFTRNTDKTKHKFENYYGKTAGMQAPSESNHLWNQWVGADDAPSFRTQLGTKGAEDMALFFKQLSKQFGMPTLSKNNNANAFADTIAQHLDNSYFICLQREKPYLAQSLLKAREEINGDIEQVYGVTETKADTTGQDPISMIAEQIEFLDRLAISQQNTIGAERFWILDYESFCANPQELVNRVGREILGLSDTQMQGTEPVQPLVNNNRINDPVLFSQLVKHLPKRVSNPSTTPLKSETHS